MNGNDQKKKGALIAVELLEEWTDPSGVPGIKVRLPTGQEVNLPRSAMEVQYRICGQRGHSTAADIVDPNEINTCHFCSTKFRTITKVEQFEIVTDVQA